MTTPQASDSLKGDQGGGILHRILHPSDRRRLNVSSDKSFPQPPQDLTIEVVNDMGGTFGKASGSGSIGSPNTTPLPSPPLNAKGKEREHDQSKPLEASKLSPPQRSSSDWYRKDPNSMEVLTFADGQEVYKTPLAPRIQSGNDPKKSLERIASSNSPGNRVYGHSSGRSLIGDTFRQENSSTPEGESFISRERAYRRFERELELQQSKQQSSLNNSSSSPVILPRTNSTSPHRDSSKQVKRVSIGQVSIDGIPMQSFSSSSSSLPRESSSEVQSSTTKRSKHRRTLTDVNSKLQTLRERTSSEPIDPARESQRRKSEEGRRRFSLLDVGRARQYSDVGRQSNRSEATIRSSRNRAVSESPTIRAAIAPSIENSTPYHPQWGPSLSTALSIRQIDQVAATPVFDDGFTSRQSLHTTTLARNRLLAQYHLGALDAIRPKLPRNPSKSLATLRYKSIWPRIHFSLLAFQVYLHVPVTIFLDYNTLFTIAQIAVNPDTNSSSAAWYIALGVYAACILTWLLVVLYFWEFAIQHRRLKITKESSPAILPIYLSNMAFYLTAIKSYSTYSLLYRSRFVAKRRDFVIETFWYWSQNWPTIATLIPRGIIAIILLVLYHPGQSTARIPINGGQRDGVYFDMQNGLLRNYSYIVILINVVWIGWRLIVLLISWIGLSILLGSKWLIKQNDIVANKDDFSEMSMSQLRLSLSTNRPLLAGDSREFENGILEDQNIVRSALRSETSHQRRVALSPTDIPRRSHSLQGKGRSASRSHSQALQSATHLSDTTSVSLAKLNPSAWKLRAEERINALLLQCNQVFTSSDVELGQPNVRISTDRSINQAPLPVLKLPEESVLDAQIEAPKGVMSTGIVYPFPRHSEEQSSSIVLPVKDVEANDVTMKAINAPTSVPQDDNRKLSPTNKTIKRYSAGSESVGKSVSVVSLSESVRSALGGRKSQETENNRRSIETLKHPDSNVLNIPDKDGSAWWSSTNETRKGKEREVEPPRSGASASLLQSQSNAMRSNSEAALAKVSLEDVGNTLEREEGDETNATVKITTQKIEEEADSGSTTTDDSEEQRIWSQFPEQSRRNPPGLIAFQLEQRRLAEELEENVKSKERNQSNTQILATLSNEGLVPIQEESWNNSQETHTTDDELAIRYPEYPKRR